MHVKRNTCIWRLSANIVAVETQQSIPHLSFNLRTKCTYNTLLYAFFWVIPRRLKFRGQGIAQKKPYYIQNTAKVSNHDIIVTLLRHVPA